MYYFCNKKTEIKLKQNKVERLQLAYLIKQMKHGLLPKNILHRLPAIHSIRSPRCLLNLKHWPI